MTTIKKIAIASDHGGFKLKEKIRKFLVKKEYSVLDLGPFSDERCDYPGYAFALAQKIASGKYKQGILICKTGIGNSIVANRVPGVRAALCYNVKAAELSRQHNDANVLVLGALFVNPKQAEKIIDAWLATEFEGGRHKRRLGQIKKIEKKIRSAK